MPWVTRAVVLASAVVAACANETVQVGGSPIEVIFPGGTTGNFEIGEVTLQVECTGQTNSGLPQDVQPQDGTNFIARLEFENVGQDGQEVWTTVVDLLGVCTFTISAFEPDGEQFCSGQGQTTVNPGDKDTVSIVLNCDVSQSFPTGSVDLEATPVEVVGNFCPFFNFLELVPDDFQNTAGATTDVVMCGSDMADENPPAVVTSCGNRCDGPDLNRLTIVCIAERIDIGGVVLGPSTGIFADANDKDGDGIPETTDGRCDVEPPTPAMSFTCDTANEPGAFIRITCCGGDGDVDCDKCMSHDLRCPP